MDYEKQNAWRAIQEFLPEAFHFSQEYRPAEDWWQFEGHNVHLDRFRNAEAPAKVVLFHGVGTNGRQMSLILGGPLSKAGYETVSVDMPTYGVTEVNPASLVSYEDWVKTGAAFIEFERTNDTRPIFLYGLSAGGMLTYHVAAVDRNVNGIIGMTFLDQREQSVRDKTTRNLFFSRIGCPLTEWIGATIFAGIRFPMSMPAKMNTLVNDPELLKVLLTDTTSAGNWVTAKFLGSYLSYQPEIEPEEFDICPILLTQPARDAWTPLELSEIFLARCKRVEHRTEMLDNAGHYPIEQPGLDQMKSAIEKFIGELV